MASVKLPNVSYIDTLDRVSKERYLAKIDLLCGLDPYANSGKSLAVTVAGMSSDYDGLPSITYPDIVNYLVNAQSPYTMAELKAYKSLEAYNLFVCGWVKHVQHLPVSTPVSDTDIQSESDSTTSSRQLITAKVGF